MCEPKNDKSHEIFRRNKLPFKNKWAYISLLLLAALLTCLLHIEHYIEGMTNYGFVLFPGLGFWGEIAFFLSIPVVTLICLVLLIAKLIRRSGVWKRDTVMSIVLLPLILWGYTRPGCITFTYGFRKRMRKTADIPAIRSWLEKQYAGTGKKSETYPDSDSPVWPKCINELNPGYVSLNNHHSVRLTWGGGFGHWGLVVGPEDMETPLSDLTRYGEYRLTVCPGAYVWHEIQ